jgi:hypothetical protein
MQMKTAPIAAEHRLFMPPITPPFLCFSPLRRSSPAFQAIRMPAGAPVASAYRCAPTESTRQQPYWKRTPIAGIDRQYERRIVRNSLLSNLEGVG